MAVCQQNSTKFDVRVSLLVLCLQLAEAIKGNTSLKLLDIGGNNIGPEGIKVLLEALRGNETLTTLELGYNPIGEEGAKHLADVLKYDLRVSFPDAVVHAPLTHSGLHHMVT